MTHYDTLGVAKNASDAEIKKAYKRKARQHHPDKGGDAADMAQVNVAYRILSNPEKRERYDRVGDDGSQGVQQTAEEKARVAVYQTFTALMENAPEAADLFALLRLGIGQQKRKLEDTKKDAQRHINKMRKLQKRIRRGGELFEDLFNSRIIACNNTIAKCDEDMKVCELSLELIKECEMEVEAGAAQSYYSNPFAKMSGWSVFD